MESVPNCARDIALGIAQGTQCGQDVTTGTFDQRVDFASCVASGVNRASAIALFTDNMSFPTS